MATLFWFYVAVFGALAAAGIYADLRYNKRQEELTARKQQLLADLTRRYNEVTLLLVEGYRRDKASLSRQAFFGSGSGRRETLRRQYERKYLANKSAYETALDQARRAWNAEPEHRSRFELFWKWLIAAGLAGQVVACTYTAASVDEKHPDTVTQNRPDSGEPTAWNAANIPIPHLSDGTRYVSNPDGVVCDATVRQLDALLRQMDDSLGIESAVVVVRRVENQDIFRFSQDLFDRYHIGKNDRGLVMVLAYDDHLFRTHTGRSLEADLTDAECFRLQERYVIPSMKAGQPDSGMIYMVEGLYDTLIGKELPEMSASNGTDDDDFSTLLLLFLFLPLTGWAALVIWLAGRYGWSGTAASRFMANPFPAPVTRDSNGWFGGGGGGFGGFSGGGGGGFSGGFSGGSSGGGGATSGW